MPNPLKALFVAPSFGGLGFHAKRIRGQLDRHSFTSLLTAVVAFVLFAAFVVTRFKPEKVTVAGFGTLSHGRSRPSSIRAMQSDVSSPGGFVVGWLRAFFGLAIVAAMTGAVVGFFIRLSFQGGPGHGRRGYRDHIVVCGWNATARDLIEELKGDEYTTKVVLLHEAERNPAGDGVYFVRGDITNTDDLERCGIREATSAIVFPTDRTDEADMRSILAVMAIESIAPAVRTVVEANNPAHVGHFRRADADEILVTSRLASRLLARSALYPGLSELVTDIVSGGTGSSSTGSCFPTRTSA